MSDNVRRDIWYKLWGNLTMNPVSAITGATIDRILADPAGARLLLGGHARGGGHRRAHRLPDRPVPAGPPRRHRQARRLPHLDAAGREAGRPIELDAIVGAVHEIGQRLGEPMPHTGALLGLTRLFAQVHGLYPA
jgi:2-dehydropantoate 2-reductase